MVRKFIGRAGRHPAAPGESDDREGDGSARCAPKGRFGFRWNLHGFAFQLSRRRISPLHPTHGASKFQNIWAPEGVAFDYAGKAQDRLFNFIQAERLQEIENPDLPTKPTAQPVLALDPEPFPLGGPTSGSP